MKRTSTLVLFLVATACQSVPPALPVSSTSSILAVDVIFPMPLQPDPGPAAVFFVKEASGAGLQGTTAAEILPASWIKGSRAYLLNPEPGTYYVAAAVYEINMAPMAASAPVGGGVSVGVSVGGAFGHAVILSEEMTRQTKTTIGPARAEFMGALRLAVGDRINANAEFQDDLQKKNAEILRPGSTSATGLSGYTTMTWMVNLDKSSVTRREGDREDFFREAANDFAESEFSRILSGPR